MSTQAATTPAQTVPDRPWVDILLIDDDPSVREMLIAVLQHQGYSLQSAPEGKTALKLFSQHRFRLVVTDIFMPDMDGIEVIMKCTSANFQTPILAISGGGRHGGSASILRAAKGLGCRKILNKPFEMPEFLSTIAGLIGQEAVPAATGT